MTTTRLVLAGARRTVPAHGISPRELRSTGPTPSPRPVPWLRRRLASDCRPAIRMH